MKKKILESLKNLKRSFFWKLTLRFLIKPILDFTWKNIINFNGRILYLLWFLKKRNFIKLNDQSVSIINDNSLFINLADNIYNYCSAELIDRAKKKMFTAHEDEQNESNSKDNKYSVNIYPGLDEKIKKEIFEFASSDLMVSTAAKYLGIYPILSNIIINYNIPRNPEKVRGAMLWHRDDLGYKSLDLFVAISDIDEDNGPLHVLKDNDKLGTLSRIDSFIKNPIRGERQKIDLNEFNYYTNNQEKTKLDGKKGTALLIDSITNYHRGGNCKKRDRLMLRISYQGLDYIPLKEITNEQLSFNHNIKKKEIKNIFKKYLFFKRSKIFNIKVKYFLVNFYNIISYKISKNKIN